MPHEEPSHSRIIQVLIGCIASVSAFRTTTCMGMGRMPAHAMGRMPAHAMAWSSQTHACMGMGGTPTCASVPMFYMQEVCSISACTTAAHMVCLGHAW